MSKFDRKTKNLQLETNSGFTLIEMLVVVGIISAITGIFLVNFNKLEGARNIKIAQNQLTTDIRKIQSYTLSSRNVSASGNPANYYVLKFDLSTPQIYTLGAIDNSNSYPEGYSIVQTSKLPKTVQISDISIKESDGDVVSALCAEAAFALPFGRVYMDYKEKDGTSFGEDQKLIMGEGNLGGSGNGCDIFYVLMNSGDLSPNRNIVLTITLQDITNPSGPVKTIELNGISQVIQSN